jgi:F0F1-type ATP synthase assembly protein I
MASPDGGEPRKGGEPYEAPQSPSGLELVGLGIFLAAVVVVPLFLGILVDAKFGTAPLGIGLGLLLGILGGFAGVYMRFKRYL